MRARVPLPCRGSADPMMHGDVDAQVEVTFTNFGEPQKIVYHLHHGNGVWRIANIEYAEDSLYGRLKDAAAL